MQVFAHIPIAPAGGFWCRPHLIGSTDQEIVEHICNRVAEARQDQIGRALNAAANELNDREPMGRA